jgi:hypothetical protein
MKSGSAPAPPPPMQGIMVSDCRARARATKKALRVTNRKLTLSQPSTMTWSAEVDQHPQSRTPWPSSAATPERIQLSMAFQQAVHKALLERLAAACEVPDGRARCCAALALNRRWGVAPGTCAPALYRAAHGENQRRIAAPRRYRTRRPVER